MSDEVKIGVVSCSGEDCLGGAISRLATLKMLNEIRPDETVTICLPLFLAGGEEERGFAQSFPTLAVDGCNKLCAKRATEKYSGKVSDAFDVSDLIGKETAASKPLSTRYLTQEHQEMVNKVAKEIRIRFEDILMDYYKNAAQRIKASGKTPNCGCNCGK